MTRTTIVAAIVLAALCGPVNAGDYNTGYFGSVAIEGYDPVAYFSGSAQKGESTIAFDWGGATWYFANANNRAKFALAPETFAPQFGGLCAEGVSFNELTVNIEPEVFQVLDGKLYMNAAATWLDLKGNLPNAEKNWPGVHTLLAE